jgi:NAD(P)H-hydrate epimerase
MKKIVNAMQMKQIDSYSIHTIKIPSLVLMEQAAKAVAKCVKKHVKKGKKVLVVCGMGNNGADGIAAGRMLFNWGYEVWIFCMGNRSHATPEWQTQEEIAKNLGIPFVSEISKTDVIIDAIFGIGLSREITGEYAKVVEEINQSKALTVSVDIASGVNASDGSILGCAVRADYTVTFGYQKIGMLLYPGLSYSGKVTVVDIGFPKVSLEQANVKTYCIEDKDLKIFSSLRPQDSHKGTFGKVLVIAGSLNMAGAAIFSAKSAYRMGSGLVKVYTPKENRIMIQNLVPEAILSTYENDLLEELKWASVVVLGPGIGRSEEAKQIVETVVTNCKVPLVIDADGLRNLAKIPDYKKYLSSQMILTPHMGELSALVGLPIEDVKKQKLEITRDFPCTCVIKDSRTIITNEKGETYLNTSGCSALATAGSGDVLTGIIAGLLAHGMETSLAAAMGVFIHGKAGENAARKKTEASVIASDLIDVIGEVIK